MAQIILTNGTAPSTPSSGNVAVYSKTTDKRLYYKDDTGLEIPFSSLTLGTPVASTSGTAIDFTGLPTWTKRITITGVAVSTTGTSGLVIRLGSSSGGIESTTYVGVTGNRAGEAAYSTGFGVSVGAIVAATTYRFTCVLTLVDTATNTWGYAGSLSSSATEAQWGQGTKALSSTLDRVRLTTILNTDTFDAGTVNILYE